MSIFVWIISKYDVEIAIIIPVIFEQHESVFVAHDFRNKVRRCLREEGIILSRVYTA